MDDRGSRRTLNRHVQRELGIEVEIEYFEGGFTLKYRTCPYYKLVKKDKNHGCATSEKKAVEYMISRVTRGGKGRIKMMKSLLKNEHPCEYAIFLTKFLEEQRQSTTSM